MKKTTYSLIYSLIIFSYFLLNKLDFAFKSTISLLILFVCSMLFNRDSKYKKNSGIYLLILSGILIIPSFIKISQKLDYLLISPIFDGFIISIICFILLNYFIYE